MPGYTFWGLSVMDLLVVAAYLVLTIVVAYRALKRIRNQEDFFLGGRRFGKLIQTFAAFGQATSVETVTTTTTTVSTNGAAGVWALMIGGLINMPIFWMTSVWYRRLRLLTLADFFEDRYGSKRMSAFFALCQTLFFVLVAAIGLTAMGKTVAAITAKPVTELTQAEKAEYQQAVEREKLEEADFSLLTADQKKRLEELRFLNPNKEFSYISETGLIIGVAIITLLYASAGGLAAAFITDLVQGVFILILTVLLIPFAMLKLNKIHGGSGLIGPFETMHKVLPSSFMELWGSPALQEFTWYWIAVYSLMGIIHVAVQGNQLTACASAKDEYTARYGFVSGVLLKRYANVLWGLLALFMLVLYGSTVKDPDYVWGHATRDLLGPAGIGLVGLMIASLMAALMAAKSAMMLTTSALITCNLYRPLVSDKSENHYVWAGRIFSALYMIISIIVAVQFKSVFGLLKMIAMFNCILAASFWLGLFWRRANRIGAWSSMIAMFVLTVLLPFGLPLLPGVATSKYLQKTTNPSPMTRNYIAREMDVQERQQAIERWDRLNAAGKAAGERPVLLKAGERFDKTFLLPKKSIFWSEGIKVENGNGGRTTGMGTLKVELVALDWCGWDLSKNSYALNETLTMLFRIITPLFVLLLISRFTRPEPDVLLNQFYGKMRTPVCGSHEDDDREMALTRANPLRFNHLRLFPNSQWEFRRWNREDWIGIIGTSLASLGVVVLLILMVKIGG